MKQELISDLAYYTGPVAGYLSVCETRLLLDKQRFEPGKRPWFFPLIDKQLLEEMYPHFQMGVDILIRAEAQLEQCQVPLPFGRVLKKARTV